MITSEMLLSTYFTVQFDIRQVAAFSVDRLLPLKRQTAVRLALAMPNVSSRVTLITIASDNQHPYSSEERT